MSWFKKHYNKKSAKKHGWHPNWFAPYLTDFNNELIDEIINFQTEHDLKPDGLVGPMTFRRILSDREYQLEFEKSKNHILVNGKKVPIDWDVKLDLIKPGAFKKYRGSRKPNMVVTHWDVCTSAEKCKRVLEARDISTHFCIDNDGVIYQFLDTNDVGWHAGKVNNYSIGVDLSNAYYVRYNSFYERKGHGLRPVLTDSRVHGVKLKPHLGYYPVQIEAYKHLVKTLCNHYKIPFVVPMTTERLLMTSVHNSAANGKFKGIVCHYHLTKRKIDCAGLELKKIIDSLY